MFKSIFTDELGVDLTQAIPVIKSWGLNYCDLRGLVFRKPFEALTDSELEDVRKLLDNNSLKVGCLQSSLAKVHLPDADRIAAEMQKLERIIRASEVLGCRLIRSFFFWQPPAEQLGELAVRPDLLAKVLEILLPFAEKAEKAGLRMSFENCGCTTEECFKILDALAVPSWGLAWDPKNTWMSDKAERDRDFDLYLQRRAERTICVHVKSTGSIWFEDGKFEKIPYQTIFEVLNSYGYDGPVSIETHNYDKSIDNTEASRRVLEVVNNSWLSAASGAQEEKSTVTTETLVRPWANNPLRFGVVGLGMGNIRSAEIAATSGLKLVEICDLRADRCERTAQALSVPATQDYQELLANSEIEAMMILNETGHHGDLALQALDAGKHVLITKPMDMSVEKCEQVIAKAKEKGLVLGVDHCRRLRPSLQSLKAAVEADFFGQLLSASVTLKVKRTAEYFRENGGWRGTRKLDGGVLSNQTVHHLDELLFVLGMPQQVRCDVFTQVHQIEMEDLGLALWKYDNGLIVNICATTNYPQDGWYYQMELHGKVGAYIHREGGMEKSPVTRYYKDNVWLEIPPFPRECQYVNSMDNFAAAVRNGEALLTTAEEGRATVQVINAMYKSGYDNNGNWVNV